MCVDVTVVIYMRYNHDHCCQIACSTLGVLTEIGIMTLNIILNNGHDDQL